MLIWVDIYCINQCNVGYNTAEQMDHSCHWSMQTQWNAWSSCRCEDRKIFPHLIKNQHFHLRCVPSCGVLLSTAVNFSFIPVAKNNQSFSWNQRDRQKKTEGEHVRYNMCKWGIQFQWCHSLQTLSTLRCCCMCACVACMSCTEAAFVISFFHSARKRNMFMLHKLNSVLHYI